MYCKCQELSEIEKLTQRLSSPDDKVRCVQTCHSGIFWAFRVSTYCVVKASLEHQTKSSTHVEVPHGIPQNPAGTQSHVPFVPH